MGFLQIYGENYTCYIKGVRTMHALKMIWEKSFRSHVNAVPLCHLTKRTDIFEVAL